MFQKKSKEIVKLFQQTMRDQMKQERKRMPSKTPGTSQAREARPRIDPSDVKFELEGRLLSRSRRSHHLLFHSKP